VLAEADRGISYAVKYTCANMKDLGDYQARHAPALQKEHAAKYNGKFASFRTLLEVIHQH